MLVILKGNVRHLRPTLFDLLAIRALDYFRNDERDINKPAYAFEIDKASAFDPAADFVTRKFPIRDSLSLHKKPYCFTSVLIAFHLNDKNPDALIDADINRLEFVQEYAVVTKIKMSLFLNAAVNHIAHQYENHPAAAQAWFLLAQSHYRESQRGQRFRWLIKHAREILEKIIFQKDSSEGKINAQNLLTACWQSILN